MLGSILKLAEPGSKNRGKERSRSVLSRFRRTKEVKEANEASEKFVAPPSILDGVNLRNIEFDPHLHSSLSDGIDTTHDAVSMASKLGLSSMAFAEHHRDDLDDVMLYNDDAYRIVDLGRMEMEADDRLSSNMDIIKEVFETEKEDLEGRDAALAYKPRTDPDDEHILEDEKGLDLFMSIERDYESWNDQKTVEFLDENDFDHVVLSTHYIPEKFVEGNIHEKQTQYLRKADLEHLNRFSEKHNVEDVVEWYTEETKAKLLRSADLTQMSDSAVEGLYRRHGVEPYRDIEELKKPIAEDTPVIHAHWDLILTSPDLRPHVEERHIDQYLDLAEKLDEVVEVNGRTIMKQRRAYSSPDTFYAPEDAEWFARKVIERAEERNLDYTIASDAHSQTEMIVHYGVLDSILEDYETQPLDENLYDRESSPMVFRSSRELMQPRNG